MGRRGGVKEMDQEEGERLKKVDLVETHKQSLVLTCGPMEELCSYLAGGESTPAGRGFNLPWVNKININV